MAHHATNSRPSRHKTSPSASPSLLNVFKQTALGTGFSLALGLLLSLLCSAICVRLSDPLSFTRPIGMALSCLIFFMGGIFSVRRNQDSVLFSGLFSGGLTALIFLVARLIFDGSSPYPPLVSLLLRLLNIGFSLMGAYLGRIRDHSKQKQRKHGHRR